MDGIICHSELKYFERHQMRTIWNKDLRHFLSKLEFVDETSKQLEDAKDILYEIQI